IKIKPDFHEAWLNRGSALDDLGRFEDAIGSYDNAIKIKDDYPEAWFNRGNALFNLGRFEDAIASFDNAIKFKPDDYEAWNNRGSALFNLGRFEDAIGSFDNAIHIKNDKWQAWGNRGIAIGKINQRIPDFIFPFTQTNPTLNQPGYNGQLANYQEGLKYVHKDKDPLGWGKLNQYIGGAKYFRWRNNNRLDSSLCREAIESYNLAGETLKDFPEEYLELLQDLIKAYHGVKDNAKAEELSRRGTDLRSRLIKECLNPVKQKQLALKFTSFEQLTVDIMVQSGQIKEALEIAEKGKNACLTWLLHAFTDEIISAPYEEIQSLLNPSTAIIYWHISPAALTTFIIKHGESSPRVIPHNRGRAQGDREGDLGESLLDTLVKFEDWVKEWNQQYSNYRKGEKPENRETTWRENLPNSLTQLKEQILNIAAIEDTLRDIKNLILIPHQELHRFPLHALFSDKFTISYLPSAQIGIHLKEIAESRCQGGSSAQPSLLSIEHPNSIYEEKDQALPSLPFAKVESDYICRIFPNSQRCKGDDITQENIDKLLSQNHNILHFTGHASYNFDNPLKSGLYLTGKERLRVENIINKELSQYELVSLSACETAISGNQTITTEYVGLVSSFLSRGVSHVVSTLWTVQSDASGIVMMKFYQLREKKSDIEALNEATRWLRDITAKDLVEWYEEIIKDFPQNLSSRATLRGALERARKEAPEKKLYDHPYHWSAFIIAGIKD
ncbi:MAG: CHAT domain-containing protein, partial [Microcoleaceae cyanobacterium]